MQTLQLLQTINWIRHIIKPIEPVFFELLPQVLQHIGRDKPRLPPDFMNPMLAGLQTWGTILTELEKNPDAITVLDTFGCKKLHDRQYIQTVVALLVLEDRGTDHEHKIYEEYRREILTPWRNMISCVEPLTKLIVPEELKTADAPKENVLTVELSDRPQLESASIIEVLKATSALYDAVVKIHKYPSDPPLTVLKIESGTGFTVSFKGVADVVKEMKNFVIEIWNKNRHKRADEIVNQNRAVGSSIQILAYIDDRVKKHELEPEDGERFKRAIVHNTMSLFKQGALFADVPTIEIVDNRKLLDGFSSQKLLTAAREVDEPVEPLEPPPMAKPARRSSSRSKGKGKKKTKPPITKDRSSR